MRVYRKHQHAWMKKLWKNMKKAEAKLLNRQQKNENPFRKQLLIAGRFEKKKAKMIEEFDDADPSEQSGDVHRPE